MPYDGPESVPERLHWIFRLTGDQIIPHLTERNLPTTGILHTLRVRLYEAYLNDTGDSGSDSDESETVVDTYSPRPTSPNNSETPNPEDTSIQSNGVAIRTSSETSTPAETLAVPSTSRQGNSRRSSPGPSKTTKGTRGLKRGQSSSLQNIANASLETPPGSVAIDYENFKRDILSELKEYMVTLFHQVNPSIPSAVSLPVTSSDTRVVTTPRLPASTNSRMLTTISKSCSIRPITVASHLNIQAPTFIPQSTLNTEPQTVASLHTYRVSTGHEHSYLHDPNQSMIYPNCSSVPNYHSVPPPPHYDQSYARNSPLSSNKFTHIHTTLNKLNISFSGKSGEDAEAFLLRLTEARDALYIPDVELLRYLPFLFHGVALPWFRSHQREWTTWSTFELAFRNRFGARAFQMALRVEITKRTQAEGEPVADYLTCLRALMEKANPPLSAYEFILWGHMNMLPNLQAFIDVNTVESFDALEERASQIEASLQRQKSFRAPPTPDRSVFPDLAYAGPSRSSRPIRNINNNSKVMMADETSDEECMAVNVAPKKKIQTKKSVASNPNTVVSPNTTTSNSTNSSNPFLHHLSADSSENTDSHTSQCWNCRQPGHRYRNCKEPRKFFCHGCGRADTIRPKCPKCSGNEH